MTDDRGTPERPKEPATVRTSRPRGGSTAVGARPATTAATSPRGPRRAKLAVRRVDPWSVLKFSVLLSIVLCVVFVVAVSVIYLLLSGMGVFDSINATIHSFTATSADPSPAPIFTARGVIGVALVIGLADIVLLTALATLGAFAYNLCADLVGGIEVTLAEHE